MKRVNWSWSGETSATLSDRIAKQLEKWGRRISDKVQRRCAGVPPRRIKLYAIVAGIVAVTCNVLLILNGVWGHDRPEFETISPPVQVKPESRPGEDATRRAVRSKNELTVLVDSLESDSSGKEILKQMVMEGKIKLDSSLLK